MNVNIIVAVDEYGGFAKEGKIPWSYPEDMKRFVYLTDGHVCLMGRKTYEYIVDLKLKKAEKAGELVDPTTPLLSNRESIVITRGLEGRIYFPCQTFTSIRYALDQYQKTNREIFILGGEKIYWEALPLANKVYLTLLSSIYGCDRFFPIKYLKDNFTIYSGTEDGDLKFLEYRKK